jgi:hypothetical protein
MRLNVGLILHISSGNVHDQFGQLRGVARAFRVVRHSRILARVRRQRQKLSMVPNFKRTHHPISE